MTIKERKQGVKGVSIGRIHVYVVRIIFNSAERKGRKITINDPLPSKKDLVYRYLISGSY